ncbi:MAG: hypothetical protein IKU09_10875 [Firmicutes bacterium]|nr:hypothetical protein [Bacillota bacterium]
MVFFTSDLHLGHEKIIELTGRPFRDVNEMNRVLIENFNSRVGHGDTVYFLGDVCHRLKTEEANGMIARLNEKYFVMMHYPMLSWPKKENGSIQVHGHIHSRGPEYNLQNRKDGVLRFDVGVDANNFYPVSVNEILEFFNLK